MREEMNQVQTKPKALKQNNNMKPFKLKSRRRGSQKKFVNRKRKYNKKPLINVAFCL